MDLPPRCRGKPVPAFVVRGCMLTTDVIPDPLRAVHAIPTAAVHDDTGLTGCGGNPVAAVLVCRKNHRRVCGCTPIHSANHPSGPSAPKTAASSETIGRPVRAHRARWQPEHDGFVCPRRGVERFDGGQSGHEHRASIAKTGAARPDQAVGLGHRRRLYAGASRSAYAGNAVSPRRHRGGPHFRHRMESPDRAHA